MKTDVLAQRAELTRGVLRGLQARHAHERGGGALVAEVAEHGDSDALLARVLLVAQRLEQRLQAVATEARQLGARGLLDLVGAVALALDEPRYVPQIQVDEHAPVDRLVRHHERERRDDLLELAKRVGHLLEIDRLAAGAADLVLVTRVAHHAAEQLRRLHRRAGLHVELREGELRLRVARIELHGLLVRRDRLRELLHLGIALGDPHVRGGIARALRERLLLPLARLGVLARLALDLADLPEHLALSRRRDLRELEQHRHGLVVLAHPAVLLHQVERDVLIIGHALVQRLERREWLALRHLAAVVLDEEVAGLGIAGLELRVPLALLLQLLRRDPRHDLDVVSARVAAREAVSGLGADESEHLVPVVQRLLELLLALECARAALVELGVLRVEADGLVVVRDRFGTHVVLGHHLAELREPARLVARDDPLPRGDRAGVIVLLPVLLAERDEVARVIGLELREALVLRDREVLLAPPLVHVGDRREHSGVVREPALQPDQRLERLLLEALAPVALRELELEPRLAGGGGDHRLVLLDRLVVSPRVLEQHDQPPLRLELEARLRDGLLERGDRLVLRAGLLVELAEGVPLEMPAHALRPGLLVLGEQGRERLLASIDIDHAAGELDLEVVALRRELDRAAVLGDRLVVLAHGLERLPAARHDLDLARRIAAEQLLGGGVALERDVALAGREHRVAALDPQLRVGRIELEELLEVRVRAIVVTGRQREVGERPQRLLLHVLRGRVRERLVVCSARILGLAAGLLGLADEEPGLCVGVLLRDRA